jgi:hypothetical protein
MKLKRTIALLTLCIIAVFTAGSHARKKSGRRKSRKKKPPIEWRHCGDHCLNRVFANDFTNIWIRPVKGKIMDMAVHDRYAYLLVQNFNLITDAIFKIDRRTSRIKFIWGIGRHNARAIACDGANLWVLSRSKKYFLRKLTVTGRKVSWIGIKTIPEGDIRGLAVMGGRFAFASVKGPMSEIYLFSGKAPVPKRVYSAPGKITSLAYFKGRLHAACSIFATYADHWLLIMSPGGKLIKRMHFTNVPVTGLARNSRNLFLLTVDKWGYRIHPFSVLDKNNAIVSNPLLRRMKIVFPVSNGTKVPGNADLWIAYPMNRAFQNVRNISISPRPVSIVTDKFGNRWAHLVWKGMTGDSRAVMKFDVLNASVAYTLDTTMPYASEKFPDAVKTHFLSETYSFDVSNYIIKSHSSRILLDGSGVANLLAIRNYVNRAISSTGPARKWGKASQYLYKGTGRSYGHTLSFAALSRFLGIPARAVGAVNLKLAGKEGGQEKGRTWNQVYFPGTGWIDIDSDSDDSESGGSTHKYFAYRSNRYFITFVGDFDQKDYKKIFAQHNWYRVVPSHDASPPGRGNIKFGTVVIQSAVLRR